MKKILFALFGMLFVFASCSKDSQEMGPVETWNYTVTRSGTSSTGVDVTTLTLTSNMQDVTSAKLFLADASKNLTSTSTFAGKTGTIKLTTTGVSQFQFNYVMSDNFKQLVTINIK